MIDLNNLPYVDGVGFMPEKCCFRGTRVQLLDEIFHWVSSEQTSSRIFLLTGVAGSGKSSVAHSVASYFHQQKRLGSSFFFRRGYQGRDKPDHVFSTIARDLADREPVIKKKLHDVIKHNRSLASTASFSMQFQDLIITPTSDSTTIGPIVIVIDALDECESPTRREFFRQLAHGLVQLPSNYRVILTARPNDTVLSEFDSVPQEARKLMENVDVNSTNQDISAYVHSELLEIHPWPPNLDLTDVNTMLVQRAQGLFIWASTVCKFIKGDGEEGCVFSDERLEEVLKATPTDAQQRMDELYSTILRTLISWRKDDDHRSKFLLSVGVVMTVKVALSLRALAVLNGNHIPRMEAYVSSMGALFTGINSPTGQVHSLHPSFRDYLTDDQRSGEFFIDLKSIDVTLATLCINFMQEYIECDTCLNDIDPLPAKAPRYNADALQYACRFWIIHLHAVETPDDTFIQLLHAFMEKHVRRWLEIIGIWWDFDVARVLMSELVHWLKVMLNTTFGMTPN
jgi:hypothetical protein